MLIDSNKLKEAKNFNDDEFTSNLLTEETEDKSSTCCIFRNSPNETEIQNYCGHFIVVIGFDDQRNIMYFR